MDDLVQWLGEQLDEDTERATTAAEEDGPDWRYDGHAVVTRREGDLVAVGSQEFMEPFRGEHIAEWDPARVLREIDAKRRVITGLQHLTHSEDPFVSSIADDSLRLLAEPYADRPGYQESWRS
ncbi:DUF6221 family protein [Streptomyces sp. NBC_01613]|uniref:DUF6221 family protein n=1 Tax=Streptomyces sp. NBC_01613 TaxID=2975896 RepID=UPI003865DD74